MKNKPVEKEDIQKNPDKHIDQDFEGYPHGQAKEEIIKPGTPQDKKTASMNVKDGEKRLRQDEVNPDDGSGNAFEGTEKVQDDE